MLWALELENPDSLWHYAEGSRPVGPVSRDSLLTAVESNHNTYISFGEDNLWLPFTAIQLARGK